VLAEPLNLFSVIADDPGVQHRMSGKVKNAILRCPISLIYSHKGLFWPASYPALGAYLNKTGPRRPGASAAIEYGAFLTFYE